MKFLFNIIVLFSRLPLWILYIFADLIFFLTYYIIGYRKAVVAENLRLSFPKKSAGELRKIQKAFYRNFADYIVETLKSFTISHRELRVRVQHLRSEEHTSELQSRENLV